MNRIVIIGAGQAGASLALKLRALGSTASITLVGEEPDLPYQRPPLSKAYLLGEMSRERLYLRPKAAYEEAAVSVVTGQRVQAIDPQSQSVSFGSETLGYDALALTTGSSPILLPPAVTSELDGVHYVRTLADIDALAPDLRPGTRALIVGGGYIGLEAAAVASKLGVATSIVEMSERILQRVSAPETSNFFRALHTGHGVDVIEGTGLARFEGETRIERAILTDGRVIEVDLAIVGIGIRPNVALAQAAGIGIDNGIATDAFGRTSLSGIWAAGDCASFPHGEGRIRLESVPHAIEHAECVAANILGAETAYQARPWFWSDQYDVKLQIAGLNTGHDRLVVRKGERDGSVSHWYYAADRLLSVDAMNAPRDYMVGKRLIEAGVSPRPDVVADPGVVLKSLL